MKSIIYLFLLIACLTIFSCKPISIEEQYLAHEITLSDHLFAEANYGDLLEVWAEDLGINGAIGSAISSFSGMVDDLFENTIAQSIVSELQGNKKLNLTLYSPPGTKERPLFLLIHGGAFVTGSRKDPAIEKICMMMAQRGYIAAAIDYRLMNPLTPSFVKSGYLATQDTRAAVHYLVNRADILNIDRERIFLAGISAGAITAINTAFIDEDESILNREDKLDRLYGCLDCVGEEAGKTYRIKGVINISGAVYDLGILDNNIPLLHIHGDQDATIPYTQGYPYTQIINGYHVGLSFVEQWTNDYPLVQEALGKAPMFKVYGSAAMHQSIESNGGESQLFTLPGEDHSFLLSSNETFTKAGKAVTAEMINWMADQY